MGAKRVAVLIMGLNGLWAPNLEAAEQHAQLQVTASVVDTGTVDTRLLARLRSAQSSNSDVCAAVSLSATIPLPTRISFHMPGQMPGATPTLRQIGLCPSSVLAKAQSYGGQSPQWAEGQAPSDRSFTVAVEY